MFILKIFATSVFLQYVRPLQNRPTQSLGSDDTYHLYKTDHPILYGSCTQSSYYSTHDDILAAICTCYTVHHRNLSIQQILSVTVSETLSIQKILTQTHHFFQLQFSYMEGSCCCIMCDRVRSIISRVETFTLLGRYTALVGS